MSRNRNGQPKSRGRSCCCGCAIAAVVAFVLIVAGLSIAIFAVGFPITIELEDLDQHLNVRIEGNYLVWDNAIQALEDELDFPVEISDRMTTQIRIGGDTVITVEEGNRWAIPYHAWGQSLEVRVVVTIPYTRIRVRTQWDDTISAASPSLSGQTGQILLVA